MNRLLVLILGCMLVLSGCGGGGSTAENSQTTLLASEVVSSQGGTVQVLDASSGAVLAAVEIPQNALAEAQTITISKSSLPASMASGSTTAGDTYQFGPEGLTFNQPILMTLPFNDPNNDGTIEGTTTADNDVGVRYYNESTGLWEDMTVVSLDRDLNLVTISTNHFSRYTPWIPVKNEVPHTTQTVQSGAITIDGDPSDWQGLKPLKMDSPNDTFSCSGLEPGFDLKYIYSAMDDQYVYLMVQVHDSPVNPKVQIEINSSLRSETEDLRWEAYADIGNAFHGPQNTVWAYGSSAWTSDGSLWNFTTGSSGLGHLTAWGEVLEARIPIAELPGTVEHFNPIYLRLSQDNWQNICDLEGFYPSVNWFQPINRNDEIDGKYQYVAFSVKNRNAETVFEHILNDAVIEYPSGQTVTALSENTIFHQEEWINGVYDDWTDTFNYETIYRTSGYYYFKDIPPLETGDYLLRFHDKFGNEYVRSGNIPELLDIPFVDTSTVQASYDATGNLTATWTPPAPPASQSTYNSRVYISAYSNNELVRYASVVMPETLGRIEAPFNVMQTLRDGADELKLRFRINTKYGENRSYSKRVLIPFQ